MGFVLWWASNLPRYQNSKKIDAPSILKNEL
jgi:hypothetical protein